ncbi:glycosyltransferase [Bacillus manliponensis]|uniref:glycosyltransferase n=1 Tax=Bacillus manliponensis TaxID=574376 RepID=UPI0035184F7B
MTRKKILIASFDMAIGGVERSLIGLLNQIDYSKYDVDLMLFKHEGELFSLLPKGPNLLPEIKEYATFRKPIKQILREGNTPIGITRLLAKTTGELHGKYKKSVEPGYFVIQYGWRISLPFLPNLKEEYDVAISFLWPHYFIGNKVRAKKKIGWIHTDYSNIKLNKTMEYRMWKKIDHIVAVSEGCRDAFYATFPNIHQKIEVIENIISSNFIYQQSKSDIASEMIVNTKRIKILTVGRLSYAKGIDVAIDVCKGLLEQGYNIEWYVVGYGSLEKELQGLINKFNLQQRFFLLGKRVNPYPYIKTCDIYVQPSRYEGKAITVREAQILNKPVLITNFSTAKSQLQDGVDGYICPMSVNGIQEAIRKIIDDVQFRKTITEGTHRGDYTNSEEIEKLYKLIDY